MSLLKRRPSIDAVTSTLAYSVLDAQLAVTGDIETGGTIRIDGKLRGSIRRADLVIVGAGAEVEGDVTAREVIVGGTISGNIEASERSELQASAVVTGDITAGAVLIHEGGAVRGRLVVRPHEEQAQARAMRPTPRSVRLVAGADAGA